MQSTLCSTTCAACVCVGRWEATCTPLYPMQRLTTRVWWAVRPFARPGRGVCVHPCCGAALRARHASLQQCLTWPLQAGQSSQSSCLRSVHVHAHVDANTNTNTNTNANANANANANTGDSGGPLPPHEGGTTQLMGESEDRSLYQDQDSTWVDQHAPPAVRPYLKLVRIDRPVGSSFAWCRL